MIVWQLHEHMRFHMNSWVQTVRRSLLLVNVDRLIVESFYRDFRQRGGLAWRGPSVVNVSKCKQAYHGSVPYF
jgi:hypothetical protein